MRHNYYGGRDRRIIKERGREKQRKKKERKEIGRKGVPESTKYFTKYIPNKRHTDDLINSAQTSSIRVIRKAMVREVGRQRQESGEGK